MGMLCLSMLFSALSLEFKNNTFVIRWIVREVDWISYYRAMVLMQMQIRLKNIGYFIFCLMLLEHLCRCLVFLWLFDIDNLLGFFTLE